MGNSCLIHTNKINTQDKCTQDKCTQTIPKQLPIKSTETHINREQNPYNAELYDSFNINNKKIDIPYNLSSIDRKRVIEQYK